MRIAGCLLARREVLGILLGAIMSASTVPLLPAAEANAAPRPIPDPFAVALTSDGFVPGQITVVAGQTILVSNESGVTRTITSGGDGTFDSGPVGSGSTYALAFPIDGLWVATDDAPIPHTATITVGILELVGDGFTAANAAIPDRSPPDGLPVVHPAIGIEVTRSRILIGFTSTATVPQANAALEAAGLTIVGGNRDAQVLVTEVADPGTPSLDYMQQALDILRAQPVVRTAAYDVSLNPETALPRPADPDPAAGIGVAPYQWEALANDDDSIRGAGSNYGLEAARFPQGWNWLDRIRQVSPSNATASATVVLDFGFDTSHPDLARATPHRLCTPELRCTENPTGLDSDRIPLTAHGTATAGLVGAVFDRGPATSPNSQGTVGGDPLSSLHVVPYFTDRARDSTKTVALDSFLSVLDLIIDKRPTAFPNLRVINLSAGFFFAEDAGKVPYFERLFGYDLCGPGSGDDTTTPEPQRVPCTPNTKDKYLTEFRAAAELIRPLAARLAANNVLLVVAAGNDSRSFCAVRPRIDVTAACERYELISTSNTDPFGYLASIWTDGVPPWVMVEANFTTAALMERMNFSNTGGTIGAAGLAIFPFVTATGVKTWDVGQGTSMAAPLVSAAAGLLSALSPSWSSVRSLLVDRGPIDLSNSTTPRLDLYSSLLGLPAESGIDALLDVNDTSADGNRRVTYDDRGQPTGLDTVLGSTLLGTSWSAPDGRIDMRDFRRYRDAWLDFCDPLGGCPETEQILLDGPPTHPKRDMNLDGCFLSENVPGCNNTEGVYSRVDFNGDGTLLERAFPILLTPSGTPAARGAGSRMTDLDVFQTRFGQGPNADTEGWSATDLDALLVSADVELRLDRLWADGATSAEVTVSTVGNVGPTQTFTPRGQGDIRIYSMPIEPVADVGNADLIQVRVVAQVPGETTITFLSPPLEAKAGQDLVVVPCTDQMTLTASTPAPTPGGKSLISATLNDCTGRPVANTSIDFAISSGPNGASLTVLQAVTDANGGARTVFEYPDGVNSAAQVVARAYGSISGGERLERFVDLGPADDFVIHYRFRQTILDYERTSTNDWGPGEDDCDGPNAEASTPKCFVATQQIRTDFTLPNVISFELTPGELERRGTIAPNGDGGATIDDSGRSVQRTLGGTDPGFDIGGIRLVTQVEEWDPADPTVRQTAVYDSPIEVFGQPSAGEFADLAPVDVGAIDFSVTPQQLRVNNLRSFVDYGIAPTAYTLRRGSLILPEETNPDLPVPNLYQPLQQIPTDLAFLPRVDASSFAWDWNPGAPLEFTGNGDGTYRPSSWCGTRERVFENGTEPGYWNDTDPRIQTVDVDNPFVLFNTRWRDPDQQRASRQTGDRVAPRHSGSVQSRFEFVAVVTRAGDPAPALEFPICTDSEATPFFGWQPGAPVEGQEVQFTDLSSYSDGATATDWRFSDPSGATVSDGRHTFSDNGTYPVDFTVTDAEGTDHTSDSAEVVVKNAPPTLELLPATDGGRTLHVQVDDAGIIDRQQLEIRLTSPTPGWPTGGVTVYTAPPIDPLTGLPDVDAWTQTLDLPSNLTPGAYFVVVTVLDKDGGTATASLSLGVTPPDVGQANSGQGNSGFRAVGRLGASSAFAEGLPSQLGPAAQAKLLVAPSPPPIGPVPAFVVDRLAAGTGELVTVRNATRVAGTPAEATFDPGDGRTPLPIGIGETIVLSYSVAETPRLAVRDVAGTVAAGVVLTIAGTSIPAGVAYEGVTSAPLGADADVIARATRSSGAALPGVTVRFTLGDSAIEAISGPDGQARAMLPVTGALGARDLIVQPVPDGDPVTVPFSVTANAIPVVDSGGPYTVGAGSPLQLTGTASDADTGETAVLVFEWDLDGDGGYDDSVEREPSLSGEQVRTVICGGVCAADEVANVALRVTDPKGGRATDSTTVTLVRDFALTINPASATLVPNANVSFVVSVVTTNGFTGPVTLSAPGLPAGITASFSPTTVTPDGTSLLNLRAGSTFTPQDFRVVVRGASGSLIREAGTDVSLEFGLIPVCFGALTGRATDRTTGDGVAGVTIFGQLTDIDGNYTATGLALESGNSPRLLSLSDVGSAFYRLSPAATVTIACGITRRLDVIVTRKQFGALAGTITGIAVDGTPLGPLSGVTFGLNRTTGVDGRYSVPSVEMPEGELSLVSGVVLSKSGFHPRSATTEITAGTTATLNVAMQQICTASVRVRVLDQATGRVVPNAQVDFGPATSGGPTDSNGIAILTGAGLAAPDNGPITRVVRARTPTDVSPQGTTTKSVVLGRCGAEVPLDIAVTFPRQVFADVDVLVIDDTGAPVSAALVRIGQTSYNGSPTGTDGRVSLTHLLGVDVAPTLNTAITASATGLITPFPTAITLDEARTASVTITLTRRRTGTIEGTARDRATGAPLAGMTVNGRTTGADGRYRIESIALGGINEPTQVGVTAADNGFPRQYWNSPFTQVTARADEVTQAPDLLMVRVCEAARVRGRVVNAVTREPLEGALVRIDSQRFDLTDADGYFVIEAVPVGNDNAAISYTVTASKTGFISATKSVTISCAADVVVDFGSEGDGVGVISGRVTDPFGGPVGQALVITGFGASTTTNSNGEYTITGAPAGDGGGPRDWLVRVVPSAASALEPAQATATVRASQTTTLDFVLGTLRDDPPTAASFSLTIESGPVPVTLAGADPNNDPLTFAVTGVPTNGTVTGTAPNLTYTPDIGFAGVDTITYTANDGALTSAPGVITITVLAPNQPPVAQITAPSEAEEGSDVELSAASSSDADGSIVAYTWDLDGDGAYDDASQVDPDVSLDDDGAVTVGLRVTDNRGGVTTTTATIVFVNVPPELTVEEPFVDQRSVELYGDVDDPGRNDAFTGTVDLGDGAGPRPLTTDELSSDNIYVQHTYGGGGTYTVTMVVCDDDGGCDTAVEQVVISGAGNAPPTALITGATAADEGDTVALSGSTSSDSDGTIVSYAWDLDGDGSYDDAIGPSASVVGADDGEVEVGLRVVDDDLSPGVTRLTITFDNVAPVVSSIGDVSIVAGETVQRAGVFTDPGADAWTATVDWGGGAGPESVSLTDTTFTLSRTFQVAGTFPAIVEVCDDDGECGTAAFTIVVLAVTGVNEPPVAVITAPISVLEGGTAALSAAASSDADGTIVTFEWDLDDDGEYDDASGVNASLPCADDGDLRAGVRVTDNNDATAASSAVVPCGNVAPTVAAIAGAALEPGETFERAGNFTDPGADQWTASVDWGEGPGPQALTLAGGEFDLSHVYVAAGSFTVTVEVCDDETECGVATATVEVVAPPPDPEADLAVAKNHDGDLRAGEAGEYFIDIVNAGPDVASGVMVTDTLPAGFSFVASAGSGWTCNGAVTVECSLSGGLAVGPAPRLVLTVEVARDAAQGVDTVTNVVTVTSTTTDPNTQNDRAEDPTTVLAPTPTADLSATVTLADTTVLRGATTTWTVNVGNAGPDATGTITVTLDLPAGLSFVRTGQPVNGFGRLEAVAGWTCDTTAGVVCTSVGGLDRDATATLPLLIAVDSAASDELASAVTVDSPEDDPDPSNNRVEISVLVASPAVTTTTTPTTTPVVPSPAMTTTPPVVTSPATTVTTTTVTTTSVTTQPATTTPPPTVTSTTLLDNRSLTPPTSGGRLPVTGGSITPVLDLGAVVLIVGVALVRTRRSHRRPNCRARRSTSR